MMPQGSIEGRVIDDSNGKPVTKFNLVVKKYREGKVPSGTQATKAISDGRGEFTVGSLDPDIYVVYVVAASLCVGESKSDSGDAPPDREGTWRSGSTPAGRSPGKGRGQPGKSRTAGAKVKLIPSQFRNNPLMEDLRPAGQGSG
jgi:hypothetical protein